LSTCNYSVYTSLLQVGIFCLHQNISNYYLNDITRELGLEILRRVMSLQVRKQSLTLCHSCLVCSCCCREIILLRSKYVVVLTLLEIIKRRVRVYISCQVQNVPRECKNQLMKKLPVHESEFCHYYNKTLYVGYKLSLHSILHIFIFSHACL
jgi:hypothetical protein